MKKHLVFTLFTLVFALALPNTSCSPKYGDLMSALAGRADLREFYDLIDAAGGISTIMDGAKRFTMFAPTNEAFADVDASLQRALTDPTKQDEMRNLLRLHTAEGMFSATNLANAAGQIKGIAGNTFEISGGAGNLVVNGANVVETINVGNGLIHVVDKVL